MIAALLAVLFLLPTAAFGFDVDQLPCVVCHPSRDRRAFEALSETPGVMVGTESAQEFVCLSCHNGSVVDDRALLRQGKQHPVGVRPRRPVPEAFRLYEGGTVECGTCHSPHGDSPAARRWLRVPADGVATCAGCHSGRRDLHLALTLDEDRRQAVLARGGRVGGAGEVVCATCHRVHGAHGDHLLIAEYGPDRDGLCRVCHARTEVKGKRAAEPTLACAECHQPHGNEPRLLGGGDEGPCLRCHADRVGPAEHRTASTTCSDCHSVHHPVRPDGSAAGLLRMPTASGLLCVGCHPQAGGRHGPEASLEGVDRELLASRGLPPGTGSDIDCGTCHRPHRSVDAPLLGASRALLCLYCHEGENPYGAGGIKPGVHPVGVFLRSGQKEVLGLPFGDGGSRDVLTCSSCHRAHDSDAAREPGCGTCHPERLGGADHGGTAGCGSCHQVHGQRPPALICVDCHTGQEVQVHAPSTAPTPGVFPAFDESGRRVPWGGFGCPTCHEPHERKPRQLRKGSAAATCLTCHEGKGRIREGPHDGRYFGQEHREDALCSACHPAHQKVVSGSEDPTGDKCRLCHGASLKSLTNHSPAGNPAWKNLEGRLPLFDRSGSRNDFGFITCPTCHEVHRGKGERPMRLEDRDPPDLCLACHRERTVMLGSVHDPRTRGETAACNLCHPLHARGDDPPLWSLRSSAQGSWNDRKCSPCHGAPDGSGLPHAGADAHPVNLALPSGMKPQGLPLYDPVGGKAGRLLACSTCHDLHGVPGAGGAQPRFLRKQPTEGELCTTCHQAYTSVLGTPHDLRTSAPSSVGPCGPCHTVHRAQTSRSLWGLQPHEGEYLPNRLCRSCHRLDGPVQSEYQLLQYHMKDAEPIRSERGAIYLQRPMSLMDEWALKTGEDPIIPLYDRLGMSGPEGSLQCVSCHDPHQWSPMGAFVKPGFGTLGPNVPTKFLRLKETRLVGRSVCAVCHPDDVVQRYREYHYVWEDVGDQFR